ncbi:hypothetical protein ACFYM3_37895 [Streptomyces massasporeus]|uniref:Uncharacterized protein n=1 Tax=Streptomyces massasporeus TaxID=67324 RepID=A0ABW6LT58_9ACTN
MAVLLGLDRGRVLRVVLDLLGRRNVRDRLGVLSGVARRHGAADGGEARGRCRDLGAGGVGEGGEFAGVDDEIGAPLTESLARFAFPVDPGDVAFEFLGSVFNGGLGVQQGSARKFQVLRFCRLDHVDHGVQGVALEVGLAKDTGDVPAEGEELGDPRRAAHHIDGADLRRGLFPLRLV